MHDEPCLGEPRFGGERGTTPIDEKWLGAIGEKQSPGRIGTESSAASGDLSKPMLAASAVHFDSTDPCNEAAATTALARPPA